MGYHHEYAMKVVCWLVGVKIVIKYPINYQLSIDNL